MDEFLDGRDLTARMPLDAVSGDALKLLTKHQPWIPDPQASDTVLFLRWNAAEAKGYTTINNWALADRKPKDGERPSAFYIEVEPYSSEATYRKPVRLCGSDYRLLKKVPLYHESQTRPAKIRTRTKACIRFGKLYQFDANRHTEEYAPGKWATHNADPDEFLYENKNYFDLNKIKRHLSGKAIYGGLTSGKTKVVNLDTDFHEARDKAVFLQVVRMILKELPRLMAELDGYALHHQVADTDAGGIHSGFVLKTRREWRSVYDHAKAWLRRLDAKHPDLLKLAVDRNALPHIKPNKPHTHTFSLIEVFPNNFKGLRLPLCRGRTMLLDKPLPLLPNGRQDVVGFMDYLENSRPPMAADDVVAYLAARMADPLATAATKEKPKAGAKSATTKNSADGKLIWKNRYRQNLVQFWLGTNCPDKSLDEVIGIHARIAPHFRTEDEAIAVLQEFVRELPEEAWSCSSRLLGQQWNRIDKNIKYVVKKAFAGNVNQPHPEKSNRIWKNTAKRFKQIGFDPFDKATWHKGYSQHKVEIAWSEEDIAAFHHSLKPLCGKVQHLDPVAFVNKVIALVLTMEERKDGIALTYWQDFFEDQFEIACGHKGERRHQLLVQTLEKLEVIRVCQGPMFGTERNYARRFTTGARVNAKPGWQRRLMTTEEMLREVLGCNMV